MFLRSVISSECKLQGTRGELGSSCCGTSCPDEHNLAVFYIDKLLIGILVIMDHVVGIKSDMGRVSVAAVTTPTPSMIHCLTIK